MEKKISPDYIDSLKDNEVVVFGSNLQGIHNGGVAKLAHEKFGAVWGQGVGLQGQSYGIPTIHGYEMMRKHIKEFVNFAMENPQIKFLVTSHTDSWDCLTFVQRAKGLRDFSHSPYSFLIIH